jgi:GH24 family phage-related lysozyme (muramidase)
MGQRWEDFKDRFASHRRKTAHGIGGDTQGIFDQNMAAIVQERMAEQDRFGGKGDLKSDGFFGPLPTADGQTATEYSIGVDGREIPSLVPGLSRNQIDSATGFGDGISPEMTRIANQHAIQRELQGQSPFWKTGEAVTPLPEYERQVPEYRPLPPGQVNVTQGPENNLFSTDNAFADSDPQAIKVPKEDPALDFDKLVDTAAGYEGFVNSINYDKPGTKGHKTGAGSIGYGTQITDPAVQEMMRGLGFDPEDYLSGKKKLSKDDAKLLMVEGMNVAVKDAKQFLPSFEDHPKGVREVLVDMSYNMGLTTLSQFKNFKAALKKKDYKTAAKEMKYTSKGTLSPWYKQTGQRAKDLHKIMSRA